MGRGFRDGCISLAGTEVLGMPHLHEEEFQESQVLTGQVLMER